MQQLHSVIAIVFFVWIGCNDPRKSSTDRHPTVTPQPAQQLSKNQDEIIPDDVSFSIIETSTLPGIKRSLDVRINKKVSEQILRSIALKLKSSDSQTYKRTFITYYLPGMTIGAGAWATTHFNPDLEIRILGLTSEKEKKLISEPIPEKRKIIGRWLDESPFAGSRITIFQKDKKTFIERTFSDNSSIKEELIEKKSQLGRRFDKVNGSNAGDHWIIGSDGNLQIRDNDGIITIANKIN